MKLFKVLERNQKNAQDDINENFDKLHPIGDIIHNVRKDYDPNIELGGVWDRFGKGRTIVSVDESDTDFSESEKTGGAKAHKLTNDELPTIYGSFAFHGVGTGTALAGTAGVFKGGQKNNGKYHTNASTSGADSYGLAVLSFGGNKPHNNMQPYITAYVWVRVA